MRTIILLRAYELTSQTTFYKQNSPFCVKQKFITGNDIILFYIQTVLYFYHFIVVQIKAFRYIAIRYNMCGFS